MSSQSRKLTSPQNGAKSRGPVTDLGKQQSARNAVRHGLLSKTVVLDFEDPERYQTLLDQYVAQFRPNTDLEYQTVEEMASIKWRLRRLHLIEKTAMDDKAETWDDGDDNQDQDQCVTGAFKCLDRTLSQLGRYESRLNRLYYRAFRHFQELRALAPVEATEPLSSPVGSFGKKLFLVPSSTLQNRDRQFVGVPARLNPPASPIIRSA